MLCLRLQKPTREDVETLEAIDLTPPTGWCAYNENDEDKTVMGKQEEVASKQEDAKA